MLSALGYPSLDGLIDDLVPENIRIRRSLDLPPARSEREALAALRAMAAENEVFRSYIGMGYYDCITPPVIQRNILENPGWYTAYTPYQAEIAQGRLEMLLNFQTMIADLTALPIANASLLDEGTAAAEAMAMSLAVNHPEQPMYLVDEGCHPQTIAVVRTRAEARGVEIKVGDPARFTFSPGVVGALVQYPSTDGAIKDYRPLCDQAHATGALVTAATDLLALTLLTPPGDWGADVAVGNSQRFGVPLGYGGPHAAFYATRDEYKRLIPGRIIGVSRDSAGRPALRMALQTREQHIRREKATSNICTAQVLLAVVAAAYGVYHGPEGLAASPRCWPTRCDGFAIAWCTASSSTRCAWRWRRGSGSGSSRPRGPSASTCGSSRPPAWASRSTKPPRRTTSGSWRPSSRSGSVSPSRWTISPANSHRPFPGASRGPARSVPTRSSTGTDPRPRCCAT
jgi:glycine dehydrogenase